MKYFFAVACLALLFAAPVLSQDTYDFGKFFQGYVLCLPVNFVAVCFPSFPQLLTPCFSINATVSLPSVSGMSTAPPPPSPVVSSLSVGIRGIHCIVLCLGRRGYHSVSPALIPPADYFPLLIFLSSLSLLDDSLTRYNLVRENGTDNIVGSSYENDTETGELTNHLSIHV